MDIESKVGRGFTICYASQNYIAFDVFEKWKYVL